jgi:serine/threonine-protein kinase
VRDLVMLVHAPEPIMQHGGGDAELWAILERGFRERRERWATMHDLGKALAGWLMTRDVAHDIAGFSLRPAWLGAEALVSSDPPERTSAPSRSSRPSNAPLSFRPTELDLRPTPRPSARPAVLSAEVEATLASVSARPAERAPVPVSQRDRTAPPVAMRDTVAPARVSADTALRVVMLGLTALLLIAAGLVASGKLGRSEPAPPPQAASGPSVSVAASAPPPARSDAPPSSAAPAQSAAPPGKQGGASSPRGVSPSGLKDPFR